MRSLLLVGILFVSAVSSIFASGPDRFATSDSVYIDGGNSWLTREVRMSTKAVVIISSAPADAGLGITAWRRRVITNISTCAILGLYPSDTTNTTYDYSDGVTLSSMTTSEIGVTTGNTITVNHQGAIKGVWKDMGPISPGGLSANRGVLVTEEYWK